MRTLCVFVLLLTSQGFTSEPNRHSTQNDYEMSDEEISLQIRGFFQGMGYDFVGKSDQEIKEKTFVWIAKKENQTRLLQKIKSQIIEGELDSSRGLSSMMGSLETALDKWNETYTSKASAILSASLNTRLGYLSCHIKELKDEEINENNLEEHIQALREEEKLHKDEAFELILQATGEAVAAGGCAAGGMEIPAIVEGVQATRHFVKGCKEYNEGVRCQQEAEALKNQYSSSENEPEKKWWEFWK